MALFLYTGRNAMEIQMSVQSSQSMLELQSTVQKQDLGAELISKTLDTMNKTSSSGQNTDYQFQKDVLSAATGKGTILDIIS